MMKEHYPDFELHDDAEIDYYLFPFPKDREVMASDKAQAIWEAQAMGRRVAGSAVGVQAKRQDCESARLEASGDGSSRANCRKPQQQQQTPRLCRCI